VVVPVFEGPGEIIQSASNGSLDGSGLENPQQVAMDQYLWKYHIIPFLVGWTSINPSYDLGFTRYQNFDPSPSQVRRISP
jgi:hypothetical protein